MARAGSITRLLVLLAVVWPTAVSFPAALALASSAATTLAPRDLWGQECGHPNATDRPTTHLEAEREQPVDLPPDELALRRQVVLAVGLGALGAAEEQPARRVGLGLGLGYKCG